MPDSSTSSAAGSATTAPDSGTVTNPWNSPTAPLSLAAYLTWAAIAIEPVRAAAGGTAGSARVATALGVAAMVLQLLLFVIRARLDPHGTTPLRVRLLVLAQIPPVLLAIALLPQAGSIPVLLIIVAAQLSAVFSVRSTVLIILAENVALAGLLSLKWGPAAAAPAVLAYLGFQAFASLTTTYARRAEEARDALGRINGELLATRQLLLESARSEERLRLSRELHDVAGHKLTALKLQLRIIEREAAPQQQAALADCVRLSDELLADVRGVVDTLRVHDGIDLHAALHSLVPNLPRPRVKLELAPDARAAGIDQAQALLRCAQEGLTNALRHSGAEHVWLRLAALPGGGIELQVEDDGRARDTPDYGNGLRGMRERLSALGGTLVVEARTSGGLCVRAQLPAAALASHSR